MSAQGLAHSRSANADCSLAISTSPCVSHLSGSVIKGLIPKTHIED